jgi:hypothetical protein
MFLFAILFVRGAVRYGQWSHYIWKVPPRPASNRKSTTTNRPPKVDCARPSVEKSGAQCLFPCLFPHRILFRETWRRGVGAYTYEKAIAVIENQVLHTIN